MLAPSWGVGAPSSGKSWIHHCFMLVGCRIPTTVVCIDLSRSGDLCEGLTSVSKQLIRIQLTIIFWLRLCTTCRMANCYQPKIKISDGMLEPLLTDSDSETDCWCTVLCRCHLCSGSCSLQLELYFLTPFRNNKKKEVVKIPLSSLSTSAHARV